MPVRVRHRRRAPSAAEAVREGTYLEDGSRLYRVLPDSVQSAVWLEDCGRPGRFAQELSVRQIQQTMRLVEPGG